MHVCVCVFVCTPCVYLYVAYTVCMHIILCDRVCVYVCVSLCLSVCAFVCVCPYVCLCACVCGILRVCGSVHCSVCLYVRSTLIH